MPRNNEEFVTGGFKKDQGDSTIYGYGAGQNSLGTQSGAVIKVKHPRTDFNSYTDWDNNTLQRYRNFTSSEDEARAAFASDQDAAGAQWIRFNRIKNNEQIPLFTSEYHPAKVDYTVSTMDVTPHATSLLGQAKSDMKEKFNTDELWASNNLSKHSHALANRAIKLGLITGIEGHDPGEVRDESEGYNDYDWKSAHDEVQRLVAGRFRNVKNDPDSVVDMKTAETNTRNMIRKAKQKQAATELSMGPVDKLLSKQFLGIPAIQPKLTGMN